MYIPGSLVSIKKSRLNFWGIKENVGLICKVINSSCYCIFDYKLIGPLYISELIETTYSDIEKPVIDSLTMTPD